MAFPMNRTRHLIGLLLLGSLAASGCSRDDAPRLVPLRGVVSKGGQGVTAGSIYLHPGATAEYAKDKPSSVLQSDGGFTVKTFPFGEGIAPGEYTVTLAPELAQRLQRPEYGSVEKSPWKVVVPQDGMTDLVLEID